MVMLATHLTMLLQKDLEIELLSHSLRETG